MEQISSEAVTAVEYVAYPIRFLYRKPRAAKNFRRFGGLRIGNLALPGRLSGADDLRTLKNKFGNATADNPAIECQKLLDIQGDT